VLKTEKIKIMLDKTMDPIWTKCWFNYQIAKMETGLIVRWMSTPINVKEDLRQ